MLLRLHQLLEAGPGIDQQPLCTCLPCLEHNLVDKETWAMTYFFMRLRHSFSFTKCFNSMLHWGKKLRRTLQNGGVSVPSIVASTCYSCKKLRRGCHSSYSLENKGILRLSGCYELFSMFSSESSRVGPFSTSCVNNILSKVWTGGLLLIALLLSGFESWCRYG